MQAGHGGPACYLPLRDMEFRVLMRLPSPATADGQTGGKTRAERRGGIPTGVVLRAWLLRSRAFWALSLLVLMLMRQCALGDFSGAQ
jgi:hypothetical protein